MTHDHDPRFEVHCPRCRLLSKSPLPVLCCPQCHHGSVVIVPSVNATAAAVAKLTGCQLASDVIREVITVITSDDEAKSR